MVFKNWTDYTKDTVVYLVIYIISIFNHKMFFKLMT